MNIRGETIVRLFRNSDNLPPLPRDINCENYAAWGQQLVDRSQAFADFNRLAAVFFQPLVTSLVTLTGAGGAVSALVEATEYRIGFGIAIVAVSAAAGAINTLFLSSKPERLYPIDRVTQARLWAKLCLFVQDVPREGDEELERCRQFAAEMVTLVEDQIVDWVPMATGGSKDTPPSGKKLNAR